MPISRGNAEELAPHLSPHEKAHGTESRAELAQHHAAHAEANRFTNARNRARAAYLSLIGREENSADDESFEHEYDPDTVDLLDVVGMYDQPSPKMSQLTLCRP